VTANANFEVIQPKYLPIVFASPSSHVHTTQLRSVISVVQDADLSDVLFDRAVLNGANLKNANLSRTIFTRSQSAGFP